MHRFAYSHNGIVCYTLRRQPRYHSSDVAHGVYLPKATGSALIANEKITEKYIMFFFHAGTKSIVHFHFKHI